MINPLNIISRIKLMFDLVSDLHIDQWDTTLEQKYPCGDRKHNLIKWEIILIYIALFLMLKMEWIRFVVQNLI